MRVLLKHPDLQLHTVRPGEEKRFQSLMEAHHYLGSLPKISDTLWYVAISGEQWLALLSFSASALNCAARDQWIGWDYRHRLDRLKLVVNNSRFLILPGCHHKNLGSQILSLCRRRIQQDWIDRFGYPILLLETFVDPTRFHGTVYRASNWIEVGKTKGYRRSGQGYSEPVHSRKWVFVQPLQRNSRKLLSQPILQPRYQTGRVRMKLRAHHQASLYDHFRELDDPRRAQGRKHPLPTVLALSAAAILCGMRGYKAIHLWVEQLGQKALARFRCRWRNGKYEAPSRTVIRNVLIGVSPDQLNRALVGWNEQYGLEDESLTIDGKTMCNAIDEESGRQTHIISAVGHESGVCYAQKK